MRIKRILKIISGILIALFILVGTLSYADYRLNNINNSCSTNIESYLNHLIEQDGDILMNTYLDFECDGFYIIGPYVGSQYKHELIGHKWYNYDTYSNYIFDELLFNGESLNDSLQELVFVSNKKVVGIAKLDRSLGDFLGLQEQYYTIDTVFHKTDNGYGYYKIE